jgi:hypothetical protein
MRLVGPSARTSQWLGRSWAKSILGYRLGIAAGHSSDMWNRWPRSRDSSRRLDMGQPGSCWRASDHSLNEVLPTANVDLGCVLPGLGKGFGGLKLLLLGLLLCALLADHG